MRLLLVDGLLDEPAAPPPEAHERDVEGGVYHPEPGSPAVRLRLSRNTRWVAEYYPVDSVAPVDDPPGGLAVTVRTADLAWARRLVASLGGDALVDEPAGLADEVAADARAALARYGIDAPGGATG
jgi:proteasome accessory factor C